jgi:hypothetical protein
VTCPAYLSNERNASVTLMMIASAEGDFRENDRDGNGRRDFWKKDVQGFYTLVPTGSTEMIKLIESSAAAADLALGTGFVAKAGYGFAALLFEDEDAPDPARFVFCAVPVAPASGRFVYAITHEGVLWRKPGATLPLFFPLDPAKEGWRKED